MKYLISILLLITISCAEKKDNPNEPKNTKDNIKKVVEFAINDINATKETKALYANLWAIRDKGTMFGHHESLLYGRNWINEPLRSDVKDVCGDFPAVCSLDFAKIEHNQKRSINGPLFSNISRVIKESYARGEVIIMCWHLDNPLTGGDSWDNNSNQVVAEILKEGSKTNVKFKVWLDNLAAYTKTLTDADGKAIPIIFRPFHEHTQTWNWWGKKCATKEEFIGLWQFTVKYLRNEKAIHNFIYSISPQMDGFQPKEDLLYRWPGNEYVDFIGMDCYHGSNTKAFENNLASISELSKELKKPFGVTEIGIEGISNNRKSYDDYWTKEILTPLKDKKASLVVVWRNEYDPDKIRSHFYGPFPEHSSSADFKLLYKSPRMLFSKDLGKMYKLPENVKIK